MYNYENPVEIGYGWNLFFFIKKKYHSLPGGHSIKNGLKKAFDHIKTYPYGTLIVADLTFQDKVHDFLPDIVKKLRKNSPISYEKDIHAAETELRGIDEIKAKDWISKEKRKKDLIVSSFDVTGFESEVIIFIHNTTKSAFISPNYALRAICKLIIVNIDTTAPT